MMELNKIYLGDAYELIKQVEDKSVDCIYTDLPYLIKTIGGGGFMGKRINKIRNIELVGLKDGIDYSILHEFVRVLKKIHLFIWCNKAQIPTILNYFLTYDVNYEILVWCKTNPIPMTDNTWLSDIEYCLYFREKGTNKLNKGYELKSKYFVSPINTNDKSDYLHPTIKPLELTKLHLLHATNENDLILDPFIGSGTTAVACKELGRNYIGFEINSNYYKTAVDRLNGIKANGQMSLLDTNFEEMDLFKGE